MDTSRLLIWDLQGFTAPAILDFPFFENGGYGSFRVLRKWLNSMISEDLTSSLIQARKHGWLAGRRPAFKSLPV